MLKIRTINSILIILPILLTGLVAGCGEKKKDEKSAGSAVEIDSTKDFYEQPDNKTVYDYQRFAGIYDHESTTKGFTAVLVITENGNDLSFELSVAQAGCKGEAKGNMVMVSHEKTYYVGFYEVDECPLQFTLMLTETKIDIKEVNLCRMHEANCAFEGAYIKRKS